MRVRHALAALLALGPLTASAAHGSFRRRETQEKDAIRARQYDAHAAHLHARKGATPAGLYARQAGPSASPCPAGTQTTAAGCVPLDTVLFAVDYDAGGLGGWVDNEGKAGVLPVPGARSGSTVYHIPRGSSTTLTRTVPVLPGSTYVVKYSVFVSLGSVTGSGAPALFRLVIVEAASVTRKRAVGSVLFDTGNKATTSEAPTHFISYDDTEVTFTTGTATAVTFTFSAANTNGITYLDSLAAAFVRTGDCGSTCGLRSSRTNTGFCEPGYSLVAGDCVLPSPEPTTCTDENALSIGGAPCTCKPGFAVNGQGICVATVAPPTTCSDPNAAIVPPATVCTCNTGFVASPAGVCVASPAPVDCAALKRATGSTPSTCGDCLDVNAQAAAANTVCSSCRPGFAVDTQGACRSCTVLGLVVNAAGGCSPIVPCTDPAAVRDATTGQCTCPQTTDASGACQTCAAAGLAVNPAGGCGACRDTNAVRLAGAACRCKTGFTDDGLGVCGACSALKRGSGADGTCGNCLDPNAVGATSSSLCACKPAYVLDALSSSCIPCSQLKRADGISAGQCGACLDINAAVLVDGTCGCKLGFTADGAGSCIACVTLKRADGTTAGQCAGCLDANANGPAGGLCSSCLIGHAANSAGTCTPCATLGLTTTSAGLCDIPCLDPMKTFANGACTCTKANAELKDGNCVCSAGYQQVAGLCVLCSTLGRDASLSAGTSCGLCTQPTRTVGADESCACALDSSDADPASSGACATCLSLGREAASGTCGGCRPGLVLNGVSTSCICAGGAGAATLDTATGVCSCTAGFTKDGAGVCVRTCSDVAFVPNPATGACDVSCASLSRPSGDGRVCAASCLQPYLQLADASPQAACVCRATGQGTSCESCGTTLSRQTLSDGTCSERCLSGYGSFEAGNTSKCLPTLAFADFDDGTLGTTYTRSGSGPVDPTLVKVVPGGSSLSPAYSFSFGQNLQWSSNNGICLDVARPGAGVTRYYHLTFRINWPDTAVAGFLNLGFGGGNQVPFNTNYGADVRASITTSDGSFVLYRHQPMSTSGTGNVRVCVSALGLTSGTGGSVVPVRVDDMAILSSPYPLFCPAGSGINEVNLAAFGEAQCFTCSGSGRNPPLTNPPFCGGCSQSDQIISPLNGNCVCPNGQTQPPGATSCQTCSSLGRPDATGGECGYSCLPGFSNFSYSTGRCT